MPEVQEEFSEKALRFMIKVPELAAEMLIAGLKSILHKLEQQELVGKQEMFRLMEGGKQLTRYEITSSQTQNLKQDMRVFDKLARQYGVGYSVVKMSGYRDIKFFFALSVPTR